MFHAEDWPLAIVVFVAIPVFIAAQVWAYRIGREGRVWRILDVSEPMNWIFGFAFFLLPGYLLGRAHPYPSRITPPRKSL